MFILLHLEQPKLYGVGCSKCNMVKQIVLCSFSSNIHHFTFCKKNMLSFILEIGKLDLLLTLEASNNSLCYIPLELSDCRRLKVISFDRNKLTWFPRQLCNLHFLEELSVCGNFLEFIPQSKYKSVKCQAKLQQTTLFFFFYLLKKKSHDFFMRILCLAEDSHEISCLIFSEKQ